MSEEVVKPKKKTNHNKNKGKRGESYFADILTKISGMPFQRIFTSGAATGRSNRMRIKQLTLGQAINNIGDISSPEMIKYLLIFESKNYDEVFLHQLLTGECKQIFGWMKEMMFDVNSALLTLKKYPLGFLCIKYTAKGNFVVVNKGMMKDKMQLPAVHMHFSHPEIPEDLVKEGWTQEFYLTEFSEFFELNKEFLFQKMSDEEILQLIKNQ